MEPGILIGAQIANSIIVVLGLVVLQALTKVRRL